MTATETKVFIFIGEQSGTSQNEAVEHHTMQQALSMTQEELQSVIRSLARQRLINAGMGYVRLNDNGRKIYALM